jgi:GAF domain-containing protein
MAGKASAIVTNQERPEHNERYTAALDACWATDLSGREFREFCMHRLSKLEGFDWCGVYRLEGEVLFLDAFVGEATEHTRILIGQGACGTAVAEDRDQIIEDVSKVENYLSCSLETKSEAVVLIKKNGATLGQIDIDGHSVGAFKQGEVQLLVRLADLIAERWESAAQP